MALRMILVGLVASMGFELPSSHDVESWGRSGHAWVAARVSEIATLSTWHDLAGPEDAPEVAALEEVPAVEANITRAKPVDDVAFDVVVEGMASSFSEDVATARIEAERAEAALAALVEAEGLRGPEIALEDEPLPPSAEAAVEVEVASAPEPAVAPELEAPLPAPEVAAEDGGMTRLDRLSNAVRLTRSAVQAWASLMDPAGSVRVGEQVVLSR